MAPACSGSGYGVIERIKQCVKRPDAPPDHTVLKLRRTWVGHLGGPPSAWSIIAVPQNDKAAMHGSRPSWRLVILDWSRMFRRSKGSSMWPGEVLRARANA